MLAFVFSVGVDVGVGWWHHSRRIGVVVFLEWASPDVGFGVDSYTRSRRFLRGPYFFWRLVPPLFVLFPHMPPCVFRSILSLLLLLPLLLFLFLLLLLPVSYTHLTLPTIYSV